jgi:MFS family permease
LLGERGLTPAQSAANFVPQTAAAIAASLMMGVLVDRVTPRLLVAASMTSLAGAMVLAQTAVPGLSAVVFGVAAGAGAGAIRALEAAALPRYFGLANIGSIRGLVMAINVGATAFGPLALAFGDEDLGAYGPTLTLLLAVPLIVAFAAVFAPVPDEYLRLRVRRRLETGGAVIRRPSSHIGNPFTLPLREGSVGRDDGFRPFASHSA